MSFLSNILNPTEQASDPPQRKTSLPEPTSQAEDANLSRVLSAPQPYSHHVGQHDAAHALASLAASDAPLPQQFMKQYATDRRASIELPQPTNTSRKPSSPTLDQYQVASRSPEQRRQSVVQPGFTLPPLQNITSPEQERRPTDAREVRRASGGQAVNDAVVESSIAASTTATTETTTDMPSFKNESTVTPRASPPSDARRPSIDQGHTPKAVASLKQEHSVSTHSPLRESSVPMATTETAPEPTMPSKKRPAPSKKKGMATMTKKTVPPAKKRKLEPTTKRSETPASRKPALKTGSSMGTPLNSSPAPSTRSQSADPDDDPYGEEEDVDEDEDVEGSGDVYCICRKPDNGTFMIGCDGTCDDWFHGKCVGIPEKDKNLIDKYVCPACTKPGQGLQTTWKRSCRRAGCRQPARISKAKDGKGSSKYCSDECGVLFFREQASRLRDREETQRHRASRRKPSLAGSAPEDVLGARGGVLAAGEVKSLLNASKTAEDFKKLGEGVLSPPATPDGKDDTHSSSPADPSSHLTHAETTQLESIHTQKEDARRRHQLLKDKLRFITMLKQAASRAATEKELKPKEYCGYDGRLEWTLDQFAAWRSSRSGQRAFELDTLAVENSGSAGDDQDNTDGDEEVYAQALVCDRKKCARHLEWNKLAVDDVRFEMSDNSDRMRALDKDERGIKERAVMRGQAKGNVLGEGTVEVHGLGIMGGQDAVMGGVDAQAEAEQVTVDGVEEKGEVPAAIEAETTEQTQTETPLPSDAAEVAMVDATAS